MPSKEVNNSNYNNNYYSNNNNNNIVPQSAINFYTWACRKMDMKEFCRILPKIELHAHLNGSLSGETLKKLGTNQDNIQKYQQLTKILDKNQKCRNLNDVFELFKIAHHLTSTKINLYDATRSVINEFHRDNVIYLELTTTPKSTTDMTKDEYIRTVVKAIQDNDDSIIVKLLISIDREQEQDNDEIVETIIKYKNKYPDVIRGVCYCGNPKMGKFHPEIFQKLRKAGLYITLHCGEIKNDKEIKEMLKFKPDRLGHCTYLHPKYGGSEENWQLYKSLNIPVELCLTSNVCCGTTEDYKSHHMFEWIKDSLPFSLCTDDKGVFCTDLSHEYYLAYKNYDLTPTKLWRIPYKATEHIFGTAAETIFLKMKLKHFKNVQIPDFT